jgi:hypothetical protein
MRPPEHRRPRTLQVHCRKVDMQSRLGCPVLTVYRISASLPVRLQTRPMARPSALELRSEDSSLNEKDRRLSVAESGRGIRLSEVLRLSTISHESDAAKTQDHHRIVWVEDSRPSRASTLLKPGIHPLGGRPRRCRCRYVLMRFAITSAPFGNVTA